MTCDICHASMENLTGVLVTREVMTCKDLLRQIFQTELSHGTFGMEGLFNGLDGTVGVLASSDSRWFLCYACTNIAIHAGITPSGDASKVAPRGHALCRSVAPMVFEILDPVAMQMAQQAAHEALREIRAGGRVLQNQWTKGKTSFDFQNFDECMSSQEGFIPLKAVMDLAVGEEVVLFIRDQTPFMEQLRSVVPFRFMMKNGVAKTSHGLLVFFLFWVEDPKDKDKPFSMWDWYANPCESYYMDLLEGLSRQTHWHLFLVGAHNEQKGFFEFKNTYEMQSILGLIGTSSNWVTMQNFQEAILEFQAENSLESLYRL